MATQQLSLKTLHLIEDGAIADDFDKAVTTLTADCIDRPAVTKARTITLKLELTPAYEEDGHCTKVNVRSQVSGKSPATVTTVPRMDARKSARGPMLCFDDEPTEAEK